MNDYIQKNISFSGSFFFAKHKPQMAIPEDLSLEPRAATYRSAYLFETAPPAGARILCFFLRVSLEFGVSTGD